MRELRDLTQTMSENQKARAEIGLAFARAAVIANGYNTTVEEQFDRLVGRNPHRDLMVKSAIEGIGRPDLAGQRGATAYVELLRRRSILVRSGARRVPARTRLINVATGTTASFVTEGQAIPFADVAFDDPVGLEVGKIAIIIALARELVNSSDPAAFGVMEGDLGRTITLGEDTALFDGNAAVPNGRPASLLSGVAPVAFGGSPEDFDDTLAVMFASVRDGEPGSPVFATSVGGALYLASARGTGGERLYPDVRLDGGTLLGVPLLISPGAAGKLVFFDAAAVLYADEGLDLDTANHASFQMDSAPTQSSVTPTATSVVSMFQTNTVAIRAQRYITWQAAADAAAWVQLPIGSPEW